MASQDAPSLLCLIVDCDADSWKQQHDSCAETQINFDELVSNVALFCNGYSITHRQNRLLLIACGKQISHGCKVVYPRISANDDFVPIVQTLTPIIISGLLDTQQQRLEQQRPPKDSHSCFISQALATALCVINRQLLAHSALQPRILVAQLSKDHAPSYNNVMNCIFSADKANVPIDGLILKASEESQFLQQACYMTRGIYQRPIDQRDTLQLLFEHYMPDTTTRSYLNAPYQKVVEFKASCFCHKKPVEFAYMCSVCLALTCKKSTICDTCGTSITAA